MNPTICLSIRHSKKKFQMKKDLNMNMPIDLILFP